MRKNPNKRIAVFALLLGLFALPLQAAQTPKVESFTLENGMEVVVVENHRVPAVSHIVWFRAGAADDPPGKSGLAHYHEHMMFQGTPTVPAGEYAKTIMRLGGEKNAFTSYDFTAYTVSIAKEHLARVMELEADRMQNLAPAQSDFPREREVIIEERKSTLESNPTSLLNEQMDAVLYRNHPYGTSVIGWLHEMQGLTEEDAMRLHRRAYHASNAILVIVGDVTMDEVRPLAERYYGPLPKVDLPKRHFLQEPPQIAPRSVTLRHSAVKEPIWSRRYMASSALNGDTQQFLPLYVLSHVLGGSTGSRLYQSLVVRQKIASSVDCDYDGMRMGPGDMNVTVVPAPGVSMDAVAAAVEKEIASIRKDGITEEELTIAKTLNKADMIYAQDGLGGVAYYLGQLKVLGLPVTYFTEFAAMVDAVTQAQVKEAANVFNDNASVTGILLPEKPSGKTGAKP